MLANWEVKNHFLCIRIRIEPEPELEILRPRECKTSKEKARLPHRPLIEVLRIGWQRPTVLVGDEGKHILDRLSSRTAIRGFKRPKAVCRRGNNLADGGHHIQIEERIRIGFGACQLEGETAIGSNLIWYEHRHTPLPTDAH